MIYHCPKCHKNILVKTDFSKMNIQGNIQIKCSDGKCGGLLKIKGKKKEEVNGLSLLGWR